MREKHRARPILVTLCVLGALCCSCPLVEAGERWSRQLTEFTGAPLAGNDWIPLSRPGSERQSGARVLNYFAAPPQSPFLDSTAQPQQHHYSFLNHQFPQSNRFLLQQAPQPQQQELLEPNQPFQLGNFRSGSPPFVGQTIQHPPPPPPPPPPSSTNPFEQQFLSKSPLSEALVQEEHKLPQPQHEQQSFSYQHIRQPELEQPQHHGPAQGGAVSQEEVQLLYVPVETLYNQNQKPESNRFNALPHPVSPSLINDFYTSAASITTTTPRPVARTSAATFPPPSSRFPPSSAPEPALARSSVAPPPSAATKPKPNQPPLALFLYNDAPRPSKLSTSDALSGLKNLNEIAVLDSVGKNSPKVFIGPSGLAPPKSYSRFDLPYLSSVDLTSARANRKIEDLPFFVAPLSYKTPGGYSKISLPPPHVGSIVVRQSTTGGNSLDNGPFYTRPTAQSPNVQYYTPSTLNFADSTTTKAPTSHTHLASSGKPIYDADHYTSPTGKPTPSTDRFNSAFNGPPPSRHAVNEEYFNLAKTRKPPTVSPPTTPNYPLRSFGSTRQFDFKPMPDQKIPPSFYPVEEDESDITLATATTPTTTTRTTTTTTERPTTIQQHFEAERMRTHFREENFRSRRPYQHHSQTQQTSAPTPSNDDARQQQGHFVHKFKLVDSVRPTAASRPSSTSVVDNGFLDFFSRSPQPQPHEDEMVKTTITTNLPGASDRQVIRNNYYQAAAAINEDTGSKRANFVSTYYSPSTPPPTTTTTATTTPTTLSTQDLFFREFEQKSKFYEREPKHPVTSAAFPTTVGYHNSNNNRYRYETDTTLFNESPRYSVEVITTSEPTTVTVDPAQQQQQHQYSIPSELPPISANLPGLVNALMDDQWPLKGGERQSTSGAVSASTGNTRAPHFRKQLPHRTTTPDSYEAEQATTTRRPLQRGRRPHPSRTTTASPSGPGAANEQPSSSTRSPISRSRSRYVPNNEERAASSRGRSRSRSTTPRVPQKEVENLDYQRDVLKQNYPVIRPQSQSIAPVTTTPAPTTATASTQGFREVYEDQTERLFATTLAENEVEAPLDPQTQHVTRKYSEYYEPETVVVTTAAPPPTTNYYATSSTSHQRGHHQQQQQQYEQQDDQQEEYVRASQEVLPLARDPDHSVIPLRSHSVPTEATPQTQPPPAVVPYQPVTESEEKLTTAYGQSVDEPMEIKKVEITPRPRRPGLASRQRDSQQNYYSRTTTSTTTESPANVRTTTPEPSAVGSRTSGRRPAFVRRPSRLYSTTTAAPPTTTNSYDQQQPTQGAYTVRTKNRQDILRGRTRRPTTTTESAPAATTASPEAPVTRAFGRGNSLRRISPTARSRQQEQQTAAPATTQQPAAASSSSGPRFRIRERTRFNLQPQESQWSTKLNQNSFQPVLKQDRARDFEEPEQEQENVSTEPEPEIITAAREAEMYFMNVSSNYGQKEGIQQEQQAPAEDSTENSVPSFADLLNDVMKDFIDDNSQKKPTADGNDEKKRGSSDDGEARRPLNLRNNFLRKRARSKVVDSFETAESQHINHAAQLYNGQAGLGYGEPVKHIDHVALSGGKNAPEKNSVKLQHGQPEEDNQDNTAQEEATVPPHDDVDPTRSEAYVEETDAQDLVTVLPVVDAIGTTVNPTTSKPTEETPTLASLEQTSTSPPPQQDRAEAAGTTTEAAITIEPTFEEEELTDDADQKEGSSFDAVKKMVSEYYKVVENDSDTEEVVDGDEEPIVETADEEGDYYRATDEPFGENDGELASPTTDMAPSETLLVPVTADPPTAVNPMGSLVIPTSVSNGITHETEICYRGRCIKTEDDKRKRKDKLN